MNGIRSSFNVEWNTNGTGIQIRRLYTFQGCPSVFRFTHDNPSWNTTAIQVPCSECDFSFPLATNGPTSSPKVVINTEEQNVPTVRVQSTLLDQPTVPAKKGRLNAYERSLLEKKELRKKFLDKWVEEQDRLRLLPFNETKFVVFTPIGYGLGNCLSILSEAIALSWVTHRRFLIYRYPSFSFYYTLPLQDYMIDRSNETFSTIIKRTMSCRGDLKSLDSLTDQLVVIRGSCKILDYLATSDALFDFFNDNGFILNPKKRSLNEIRKMIYHFIFSEVILPKPHVLALVEQTKQQLHWDTFYWIGVQVRTGHMPGDEDLNVFLMKNDLPVFETVAMNETLVAQRTQKKPVKWFLATDNAKIRRTMMSSHPEYFITANCTIRHSLRDILSDKESEGMLCTLLDNYLLSSCDELVLTLRSTYGILAANRKLDIKSTFVKRGDAQRKVKK